MLLIKRFIDIDELCVEASKRSKKTSFEFQISIFELGGRLRFSICVVVEMIPIELSCIHELKETFVIA